MRSDGLDICYLCTSIRFVRGMSFPYCAIIRFGERWHRIPLTGGGVPSSTGRKGRAEVPVGRAEVPVGRARNKRSLNQMEATPADETGVG